MNRHRSALRAIGLATAIPALAFGASTVAWSAPEDRAVPIPESRLADYTAPQPMGVSSDLKNASGRVDVAVTLTEPAIADLLPEGALAQGRAPSRAVQNSQRTKVRGQQNRFVSESRGSGARELARTELVSNIVMVNVDADELETLAALPDVSSVTAIRDHEKHSSDSDPVSGSLAQAIDYLQVADVHAAGIDGTGISVAVLDSGIDYTHVNLGGPGTEDVVAECFAQADQAPTGVCADLFGPDAPKVKGGYDFVGDSWPDGDLAPDPNPIDSGPAGGHGTSVADIIAGRSADGSHQGIAPGADLYGVTVCSAVTTSCSGVAMLQGLDWALDPNGDGDISDAVDVVNMSLGASYGQEQNSAVVAVDNLTRAGVVVVASAGNSADRPFILGSPSSAAGAISVAQTALPDDLQWVIETSNGQLINNAVHMAWSPNPTGLMSAPLARPNDPLGEGCSADTYDDFPDGAIALIQRGTCNISDKSVHAQHAGAIAAIIYNNAPGDPPNFSFGSEEPVTIPTFSISQSDGQTLAAAVGAGTVTATLDPANAISLTNTVVGTSSRGLSMGTHRAKPDIGAPGAWLAADTGTGTEVSNFGGTSGAAPVVSGMAALVLQKHAGASPLEVKARLLNGADNTNQTPAASGWYTSPVSRVGTGEVRGAPSVFAESWLTTAGLGGHIGLGIPSLTRANERVRIDLTLVNNSSSKKRYDLAATFRDDADRALGAATWQLSPAWVQVPAGQTRTFNVTLLLDGSKLNPWPFNHAGHIGDGSALNGPEFDGYLTATSGDEVLKVGWNVLPRRAADVDVQGNTRLNRHGELGLTLRNKSHLQAGDVEVFALTGTSERLPNGGPGAPGSDENIIDLAAVGVYAEDGLVQFAIANHDRYTHPNYPIEYNVHVDVDQDGTDDFVIFQTELGGFALTGESVVYVVNLNTGTAAAYFYNDAGFDSSVMVLSAPAAVLGLTDGQTFGFSVYAWENYFTGDLTDAIEDMSFTFGERAFEVDDSITVPANGRATLNVSTTGDSGESTQTGLLLRHLSAATDDFTVVTLNQ